MAKTELQWLKENYVLKDGATGCIMSSGSAYGSCHKYRYYSKEEVVFDVEKAKEQRKQKRKLAKERAEKRQREWEEIYEMCEKWHTEYQWRTEYGRIPKEDAEFVLGEKLTKRYGVCFGSSYWYCHIDDTYEGGQ